MADLSEVLLNKEFRSWSIFPRVTFGEDAAHSLGALFVTSIASAAFSRADTKEEDRVPFHVYMDEFRALQSYDHDSNLCIHAPFTPDRCYRLGSVWIAMEGDIKKPPRRTALFFVGVDFRPRIGANVIEFLVDEVRSPECEASSLRISELS